MLTAAVLTHDETVGTSRGFGHHGPAVPHQLFVGRQGIFTQAGDLHGHEFLYRAGHEHSLNVDRWSPQAQDRATLKVLEATFTSCGALTTTADTLVFINFTRSFIVDALPVPPLPSHLVIEIVESVRSDADVVAGVARLRDKGFRIALDDFVGLDSQCALLPYADYVKIDMRDLVLQGPALMQCARSYGATLVAERLETAEDLETCRRLGFELYQGNLLEAAQVIERAALPASRWRVVRGTVPTQAPSLTSEGTAISLGVPEMVAAARL